MKPDASLMMHSLKERPPPWPPTTPYHAAPANPPCSHLQKHRTVEAAALRQQQRAYGQQLPRSRSGAAAPLQGAPGLALPGLRLAFDAQLPQAPWDLPSRLRHALNKFVYFASFSCRLASAVGCLYS
jgi:hypothetical protein